MPDNLVAGARSVGHKKQVIAAKNTRSIALARGDRPGVVEQLTEFVDGVTNVRTQHVFTEELVKHLADRMLEERNAAAVPGAMPGIRTIIGVVNKRLEKRGRQRVQIRSGFANDVTRHKLRRVLKHMNEAMQFTQHIAWNVL